MAIRGENPVQSMVSFETQLRRQAERPAPELLSDRLDAWARSLPPGRLARGLPAVEVAHALRVRLAVAVALMTAAGWTYRYAPDLASRSWYPPQL